MRKSILISITAMLFACNLAMAQQSDAPIYGNWEGKFIIDNWQEQTHQSADHW